ncbi:MAG: membrane associated rhomboid family serine protease [Pirellulaceae bacterium]|jgi:membrane associated rhomboid family serine protease
MIIPTGTDAPLYHYPIATVGVIAVNVVAFVCEFAGYFEAEPYILAFGNGYHPSQWITSLFLHQGIVHLLGNMVFLLIFGLIVEGKIGWWKFFGVYLLLGAVESFSSQTLMLLSEGGGALGASGAIMGILAVAVIWAPTNNINFIWIIYYRSYEFEVNLLSVGFFYFGIDLLFLALNRFEMGSELLHLLGVLPGLVLGIVFVRRNWVDCEGYDIFSRSLGEDWWEDLKGGNWRPPPTETSTEMEERLAGMREQVRTCLQAARTKEAIDLFLKVRVADGKAHWTEQELLTIVQQLRSQGQMDECVPFLKEYLQRFQARAIEVRMLLAEHSLQSERPSEAMQLLEPILNVPLASQLHQRREGIIQQAKLLSKDVLEIRMED